MIMMRDIRLSFRVRLVVALFFNSTLCANALPQDKAALIDSAMTTLARQGQFNGSVLVAEHGKILYQHGFGSADLKRSIPFTPNTPCYLASLSKQFTAMAIMMLSEQKKLTYGDKLSKYFPELPSYAESITIRHLLNHTSGVPDYFELGLAHPGMTNNDVLKGLEKIEALQFPPGSRFKYSNSGYVLLAMIVEKASGEPYHVFLKRNVFEPLGMKSTLAYDESRPEVAGRARGYDRFGGDDDYDILTEGDGGIFSSVEDLFKWDLALYTDRLVKQSTLSEAFTPARLNNDSTSSYGFGWAILGQGGNKILIHSGGLNGFRTFIERFPKDHNTIILLTNNGNRNAGSVREALSCILGGEPFRLPKPSVAEAMYQKALGPAGIQSAVQFYSSLRETNDTSYDRREPELNDLGYKFLQMDRVQDAIEVFKLNVAAFPASSNTYDSLGEAYMKEDDKVEAAKNYAKSLELDPKNTNARKMLDKLRTN